MPGIVLVCALGAAPVHAQADSSKVAQARELFEKANAARTDGDYAACEAAARGAYAITPKGSVAGLLGDCLAELGREREAAPYLQEFLDAPPKSATAEGVKTVADRLEAIKRQIAIVVVVPSVSEATITVDGQAIEPGQKLYLDPGRHRFSASHVGYRTIEVERSFIAGSELDLPLTLEPVDDGGRDGDDKSVAIAVTIAGAILTAGAGATAIGLFVGGKGKQDDAETLQQTCPFPCAEVDSTFDEANTLLNAAGGLAIGAGVLGAATIIWGAVTLPDDDEKSISLAPVFAPGQTGLVVSGSF